MLSSHKDSTILLAEGKSGSTVDPDQIRKCQSLRKNDVAQHVTVANPRELLHEVMVVCYAEQLIWVAKNYKDAGINVPIIAIGDDVISHAGAPFQLPGLNDAFGGNLEITSEMARPTEYVPFDSSSSNGDVAEQIMPRVITYMHQKLPRFSTGQLMGDFYQDYISLLSDIEESEVTKRVNKVLAVAANTHLRNYIGREQGRSKKNWWLIKRNPYEMAPEHQSKSLEAIKRRVAKMIAELRDEPWPPEQLHFYWD